MSFFLFLMATHPEIQKKCQDELQTIFGDDDRLATAVLQVGDEVCSR